MAQCILVEKASHIDVLTERIAQLESELAAAQANCGLTSSVTEDEIGWSAQGETTEDDASEADSTQEEYEDASSSFTYLTLPEPEDDGTSGSIDDYKDKIASEAIEDFVDEIEETGEIPDPDEFEPELQEYPVDEIPVGIGSSDDPDGVEPGEEGVDLPDLEEVIDVPMQGTLIMPPLIPEDEVGVEGLIASEEVFSIAIPDDDGFVDIEGVSIADAPLEPVTDPYPDEAPPNHALQEYTYETIIDDLPQFYPEMP